MQKALTPLARLIRQEGQTLTWQAATAASQNQPWRVEATPQASQHIKGILHIKPAAANDSLPQGGVRGVGVLLVESGNGMPSAGDTLLAEDGQLAWRIDTVVTLGTAKAAKLIEVILTGHAAQ